MKSVSTGTRAVTATLLLLACGAGLFVVFGRKAPTASHDTKTALAPISSAQASSLRELGGAPNGRKQPRAHQPSAAVAANFAPSVAPLEQGASVSPAAQRGEDTSDRQPPPAARLSESTEVAATRRMYMAHAPLRAPEVADPDSKANRRILQTMVEKALTRVAASPQPSTARPKSN